MKNTLVYTFWAVPVGIVVAIILALAMNQKVREVAVYRAILYLPSILPAFALVFVWILFTNPQFGMFNLVLNKLGFPFIDWIGDARFTKPSLVILAQYGAGGPALIFLATLRSIPRELYESAEIDGAGVFRKFFSITLPMITPIILYQMIMGLSAGLNIFTQGYLLTGGARGGTVGPSNSLLFYVLYIYKNAFMYSRMGYAASLSVVLFLISVVVEALQYIPFFKFMRNSLILAAGCIVGATISNSLIGYGFSRIQWPFREPLFYVVIATMFIPFPVILVALFDIFAKMRMINTFAPLVIPSFVGSALYIFMIRQFLFTIPKEISDAGFVDGTNEFQIFTRLILPLMQPAIAVVAIFTALASWNDFMGPLIYIQNEELYPLSIGLQFFRTQHEVQYSMLMAASTLVALPVVVIFLCFQRFFVEGITIGALKG
jgi:ABC-type glycerol-3-phosphate transport system permease component